MSILSLLSFINIDFTLSKSKEIIAAVPITVQNIICPKTIINPKNIGHKNNTKIITNSHPKIFQTIIIYFPFLYLCFT